MITEPVTSGGFFSGERLKKMAVQMTTETVQNAKMTTESVVNFVFFETLTTVKSATAPPSLDMTG